MLSGIGAQEGASHGQYGHGIGVAWLGNRACSLKQIMRSLPVASGIWLQVSKV